MRQLHGPLKLSILSGAPHAYLYTQPAKLLSLLCLRGPNFYQYKGRQEAAKRLYVLLSSYFFLQLTIRGE